MSARRRARFPGRAGDAGWARLRKAAGLIALAAVAIPASGAVEAAVSPPDSAASSLAGIESVLGAVEDRYSCSSEDAADVLGDELPDLPEASGLRCDAALRTVGFEQQGDAAAVLGDLARRFEEKGWSKVESGNDWCVSFSKAGGRCRWASASCSQVGRSASVVIQWSRGEEMEVGDG